MSPTNTGIQSREHVANTLSKFLATTYVLYLKTQNFHWNVTGIHFYSLHHMFEEQYQDLASAIDTLAERIRALGERAPASFCEYSQLSEISEETKQIDAMKMLMQLCSDHQTIASLGYTLVKIAEDENDSATADMITERIDAHEKVIWMLRVSLKS